MEKLQVAIEKLKQKYKDRETIRALPELKTSTFIPDVQRLEDLPEQPPATQLLQELQSKFALGVDELNGGKALGNILRACQNARFTYDVLILHAFRVLNDLSGSEFEEEVRNTDFTDLEKRMNEMGCRGKLELSYDVGRRLKRIEDITTWKIEIVKDLNDNMSRNTGSAKKSIALTDSEKLCAVPFFKGWAIVFAKIPRSGPTLSVSDANNKYTWRAVAPCILKDVKKVVDGKEVTVTEKMLSKKTEELITNIWADPARGGFKGTRSIWNHVQTQIVGISESDIHEFLKKQEVSQRAKMPNTKGIYSPIVTENIGHVQMDLIVVKFGDARARKRAQQEISLEGGECEITCKRVTRAISGDDKEIVIKEISHNDVTQIDFDIGKNTTNYVYILTIIDLFSKFVWAFPLKRKSAGQVVACLENLWLTEGSPRIFQSDNGTEFVNDEVAALSARFNVERRLCRPYNSQCNGAIERLNRTIQTALARALYTYNSNKWHEMLPLIVYAYNTTRHSTTNLSPFLVQRGRDPAPLGNVLLRPVRGEKKKEKEEEEEEEEEELQEVAPQQIKTAQITKPTLRRTDRFRKRLSGGNIDEVLLDIDDENRAALKNISKESRQERYPDGVFNVAIEPLSKLIVDVRIEEDDEEGHSYRIENAEKKEIDNVEDTRDIKKEAAQLLATNEARRQFVHDRIKSRANLMVSKSIEKYGQMKGIGVLKTDEYEEPLEEDFSSLGDRVSQGQRVRLSLLYFSKYRRDHKSPFRRGSVASSLWSPYTFRVVAQKNLQPVHPSEKYIAEYWIRLEEAQDVPDEEKEAMQNKGGVLVILAQRQQLLPIPDETIVLPRNELFTFASRIPRAPEIQTSVMKARLQDITSPRKCLIK